MTASKSLTASAHYVSFGVPFRLAADSAALLQQMIERAPFGTSISEPDASEAISFTLAMLPQPSAYQLCVDNNILTEGPELEPILDLLARDLMVHVANHAPDRVFLHAGVVGWQGRALVFPGASFAGKTTLAAELVRAGATYYSDEYAVLDQQGRVHPYSRALQMRSPGSDRQTSVPVEQLHGSVGRTPLPVSHVFFAEYVVSAQWNPHPITAGNAVLEMLRHAIPVQRTPARVMATLAAMMQSATALESLRGDARETAHAILTAISGDGTVA